MSKDNDYIDDIEAEELINDEEGDDENRITELFGQSTLDKYIQRYVDLRTLPEDEIMNYAVPEGASFTLPVLPLKSFVMFPRLLLNFELTQEKSIALVKEAIKNNQKVFAVTYLDPSKDDPSKEDLSKMGVVAKLEQVVYQREKSCVKVLATGIKRALAEEYIDNGSSYMTANVDVCIERPRIADSLELKALIRKGVELYTQYLSFWPKDTKDLEAGVQKINELGELADYMCSCLPLPAERKQEVLEKLDVRERLDCLLEILASENEILDVEVAIAKKLKIALEKGQRDYVLKEHMKILSREIGEEDAPEMEAMEYKDKIRKLKLPDDVFEKLMKECDRFAKIPSGSVDSNVSRSYIESCLELPWNEKTRDCINIKKAKEILDRDHYGLDDVKERILEILSVRKLSKNLKGQILCLDGPPGVGKTSIAKSMAEAMGRKYERVSLGGIRDEAEIRGHRRTYIGAMPGRIISAVKQSGVRNPLILLDEVDKLANDAHGDPSSALLEALDPEQNSTFYDHYIDLPFDLSDVLFITTSNDKTQIPKPLLDRMEVISLYSYTHEEKFNIAKKHLLKKQLKNNGLTADQFSITDNAIHKLIENYTKEAGVRGLEKELSSLMRKVAKKIALKEIDAINIDVEEIRELLGPEKFKNTLHYKNGEIGIAKGLAWTAVGGETLPIEVVLMKGKGKVQVTGSLGDVMKESAQIAVSYIRSNCEALGVAPDFHNKMDIHIHAPEGAVPKDGPSAGVTIATALVSALTKTPVNQNVAMTGEITLKGKVLAVGGLKEKTMAAYRDRVETVIVPADNESDLEKIDDKVKKSINFILADDLDTVFKNSCCIAKEKQEARE